MRKQVKKAAALLMAAVMALSLNVVMPREVRAASQSYEYCWDTDKSDFFTIPATVTSNKGVQGYEKALKLTDTDYITFTVPSGKFAKVTVWAAFNGTTETLAYLRIAEASKEVSYTSKYGTGVAPKELTFPGNLPGGESGKAYTIKCKSLDTKSNTKQSLVYKVKVDVYDTEAEVPADKVDTSTKVSVAGTITSEVDLTGGTITLIGDNAYNGTFSKKEDGEYAYSIENVVGDGAQYSVRISSDALKKAKKLLDASAIGKITVNTTNISNADYTLQYEDITNTWDFKSKKFEDCIIQRSSGTYKGLDIDATGQGDEKFAISLGADAVQTNNNTKIKVPVTGEGTVKVTTKSNVTTFMLNGTPATSSPAEISYTSDGVVEIMAMANNTYIEKIEVIRTAYTTNTTPVNVQYKKNEDNTTYTVRTVYEISETDIDKYDEVGVRLTVGEQNEDSLGTTVYKSLEANGQTVSAGDGKYYVITQIEKVPADAVIDVKGLAKKGETVEVLSGVSGTVKMAEIIK